MAVAPEQNTGALEGFAVPHGSVLFCSSPFRPGNFIVLEEAILMF
jgi:hypothetical protein